MSRKAESLYIARAGQRAARENVATVPFLYSSPNWMLFMAGKQLRDMGDITSASMSRGYSVKLQTAANDFLVTFDKHDLNNVTMTRLG